MQINFLKIDFHIFFNGGIIMNSGIFNGKFKTVTFSFDDGVVDDIRLIELFKKYGIKATFNLNSASLSDSHGWTFNGEKYVTYVNYTEHPDLYDGFEVASHTYRHPFLEKCNDNI